MEVASPAASPAREKPAASPAREKENPAALRRRISELEAEAAEAEAVKVAAQAKANAAAEMQARVAKALEEQIKMRVADAASHNESLAVAPPLAAAAITATFHHARALALARRGRTWQPSEEHKMITFTTPVWLPARTLPRMCTRRSDSPCRNFWALRTRHAEAKP